jgi:FtsP/CotA-like multicopper oxidase with cupredoxin domain
MTPPRAGTFIYHTHWHDRAQLLGGLYGPLIVLEPGEKFDPDTDKIFTVSRGGADASFGGLMLLNGAAQPRELRLKAGTRYRLRFINITDDLGRVVVSLLAANSPVTWRAISKDGADLPLAQRIKKASVQAIGVGETYDFEFVPEGRGELALTVNESRGYLAHRWIVD